MSVLFNWAGVAVIIFGFKPVPSSVDREVIDLTSAVKCVLNKAHSHAEFYRERVKRSKWVQKMSSVATIINNG